MARLPAPSGERRSDDGEDESFHNPTSTGSLQWGQTTTSTNGRKRQRPTADANIDPRLHAENPHDPWAEGSGEIDVDTDFFVPRSMVDIVNDTIALLNAVAATGKMGCEDMNPTADEGWCKRSIIACWQQTRAMHEETNPEKKYPSVPSSKVMGKIREALRKYRNSTTDRIRRAVEVQLGSRIRSSVETVAWAKEQLENSNYECEDGKADRRYLGSLLVAAFGTAYCGHRGLALPSRTRYYFLPPTAFLIASLSATIHNILLVMSQGFSGLNKDLRPRYNRCDSIDLHELFRQTDRAFRSQYEGRRTRLIQKLNRRMTALADSRHDLSQRVIIESDIALYANTLDGLEDDSEEDASMLSRSRPKKPKGAPDGTDGSDYASPHNHLSLATSQPTSLSRQPSDSSGAHMAETVTLNMPGRCTSPPIDPRILSDAHLAETESQQRDPIAPSEAMTSSSAQAGTTAHGRGTLVKDRTAPTTSAATPTPAVDRAQGQPGKDVEGAPEQGLRMALSTITRKSWSAISTIISKRLGPVDDRVLLWHKVERAGDQGDWMVEQKDKVFDEQAFKELVQLNRNAGRNKLSVFIERISDDVYCSPTSN